MTINDILSLNLTEDIKHVIDLEDQLDNEIQSEIENYIVTDGIGKHLYDFSAKFTSNIRETGVWISGFYGSGKSYFGKMLGFILANKLINGTHARDRFIPRLRGVADESLIVNKILRLNTINSRVVFLDIAKQNTDNGLAFTLFSIFLKTLGFRNDLYGYMEYELMLDDKYETFKNQVQEVTGREWKQLKSQNKDVAKAMKRAYLAMDYTESEYEETINLYKTSIQNFSASSLRDELRKYIEKRPDETVVFIFDEVSEAISQQKFNLLDLEGLSESLSSLQSRVWTIAIAQEKLDDVINNSYVNKSQLTKVTDRFKTKIHLESTEVDVIIRNRLLQKKEDAYNQLMTYYRTNDGLISDATNLKSSFPTKTISAEQFATYYPFHKYQFSLLQKFLFSANSLVASQIAARGMIITTFDVLRKEMKEQQLYHFVTAHDLCTEAQTAPPADLVNKYETARKIIEHQGLDLDGEKLMKTIHFVNESDVIASPTIENITKTYISDLSTYYTFRPIIEKALELLLEAKLLLLSNNNYKITSNLEGKLLEEMKDISVELFIKKRELVTYLKKMNLFRQIAIITEDAANYNFNILTDLEDEIISSSNKHLKLSVYSLFNINQNREDFIEGLKLDTQNAKNLITLVPDNTRFAQIDKLIEEVKRYSYMEEKYANDDDPAKRQIIREFVNIRDEKEKDLINLIEQAYSNGSLIYLFDEMLLNRETFKTLVNDTQRRLIANIYTRRLPKQLSDALALQILNEDNNQKLNRFFSGDDFKFFDANGNFVGDHLKVVEEITGRIRNKMLDGRSLEEELLMPPCGYTYGTIATVLAVLLRAGKLVVKTNDSEYFSHRDKQAHEVFATGNRFRTARFKSITKSLSAAQKNQIVQALLNLDFEKHTDRKLDWSTSDFDLANAITLFANDFINKIDTLRSSQADFDKLFGNVTAQKQPLQHFTAVTTEANYIEKAETFLNQKEPFTHAINTVLTAQKFIKRNLDKIKGFNRFVTDVNNELKKAGMANSVVASKTKTFNNDFENDVIEKFDELQDAAQSIKDEYFRLMQENAMRMSEKYSQLLGEVEKAQQNLTQNFPAELNTGNASALQKLHDFCKSRIVGSVRLEYHIECQDSHFSLSDILNYIDLHSTKTAELQILTGNFVTEPPMVKEPGQPRQPRKVQFKVKDGVMKVKDYRHLLASQIQTLAGMDNDDEIELTINNQ